jgi:hypothetical protein
MSVGWRPTRQNGERFSAQPAQASPHPDPVVLLIVRLLTPLAMADDRCLTARGAPPGHLMQVDWRYPGSVFSSDGGSTIKRIMAGVRAGR